MNRLKSIFISLAVAIWVYFSFLAVMFILKNGINAIGIALTLVSFLPLGFFILLLAVKPFARTTRHLFIITLLVILGVLIAFSGFYRNKLASYYFYISFSSLALWLIYVYWYSVIAVGRNNLKIGVKLPPLSFIGESGFALSTAAFSGKKVLYMFYRGNWCPLCMAQIKEISAQYKSRPLQNHRFCHDNFLSPY